MAIKFDTFKTSTASASDVTSVNGEQGDVIVTLDSATDQGATTTNSITVGGLSVGTAYSLPTADGTANQSLVTDGSGNLSFTTLDFTGGLEYKGTFNATAGTPSLANAEQGDYYKVDTAGTIYGQTWAVGDSLLINADMGGTITNSKIDKLDNTESVTSVNSQTGAVNLGAGDLSDVTITGAVNGEVLKYNGTAWVDANVDYNEVTNTPTNVSTFTNDANYVASGDNVSVLTNDAGYITSVNSASETVAGVIEIATNAEATAGTATDKALVPSNISSIALSSFNDDLSYLSSGDNVSELTNDAGYLTSVASASETIAGVIEIATNAEATAGTATDKALVPSNISSIALSSFNDDLSYLSSGDNVSLLTNDAGYLTDITAEGLNDLSDVSFTAGVGIDGHVLTYDNTAGEWQAVAPASGGLSSVVQDTTPQLGGALDVNGQEITSASNGNVVINPDGTGEITIGADVVPDADATHTIGSESNRYISTYSDLNGAIRFKAKNNQGSAITKGQAVYISGVSGTIPEVKLAQANSALTMPAFGLALNNANDQAEIQIITFGNLTDYNTTTYSLSANDTVYVSATTAGALTNSAPAGESNLIQNIGRVVRADASAGIIKVGGAGRSNATPNLDQNKIFLGNASNQSVSTALSSIALSSFNDDLSYLSSGDNVSLLTNDAGYLTSVASASETAEGIIEIATNAEATAGTATNKALVPSNISSIALSSFNDDLSYLSSGDNVSLLTNDAGYLTGITGESIGDLSDVTITSVASGEVLKYNGTAWVNDTISAGGGYTFSAISSATTAQISYHYSCDTSASAFTLTLPALSGVTAGQEIRVKLATAGNDLTIARTGSDTIDGLTSFTLSTAKSSITLVANTSGTDWEIV